MSPLAKGILAILLLTGGGYIWFGFVGTWTLIGLVMLWAGGGVVGSLAAQAERP